MFHPSPVDADTGSITCGPSDNADLYTPMSMSTPSTSTPAHASTAQTDAHSTPTPDANENVSAYQHLALAIPTDDTNHVDTKVHVYLCLYFCYIIFKLQLA